MPGPLKYLNNQSDAAPGFLSAERAPNSNDQYPIGFVWYDAPATAFYQSIGAGSWQVGGNEIATDVAAGIVYLTDNDAPVGTVATKAYADNLAIVGSPVSTTTTSGIGRIVSDANAVSRIASTGVQAYFVQPSNLTAVMSAPGPIGDTTPSTAAFTNLSATAVGTGNILTSDTASSFSTTGAGIDVTVDSASGRVIINGEEAAANAITLLSAAGGVDLDAALQVNIASSQNAVDAIRIISSAGGIDIDAVGAATEDINITNTGGSVVISATESATDSIKIESTAGGIDILASGAAAGEDIDIIATGSSINLESTENAALAIYLHANGGTSETIRLRSDQGTGVDSIDLLSDVGGITLTSGLASADAINLSASAGGVDLDAALQVNIASSQNAVDAIRIISSAGGIDIDAVGAATEDISIVNTGGSIVLQATESDVDAIVINASGVAGGVNVDAGTSGVIVDTTGPVSLDATLASNFTVTDALADLTIQSSGGRVIVKGEEAAASAVELVSAAGGISASSALQLSLISSQAAVADSVRIQSSAANGGVDIDSGTGGLTIDSTGSVSIDAAAASNLTVTGAGLDLTLSSVGGSVAISSDEAVATAIALTASDAAGGITASVGTGMFNIAGDLSFSTSGNKIKSVNVGSGAAAGANSFGTGTLVGGTLTVSTTAITANSIVYLTRQSVGATGAAALGELSVGTIVAGTSFVINSWSQADATALAATDVSVIGYMIVN